MKLRWLYSSTDIIIEFSINAFVFKNSILQFIISPVARTRALEVRASNPPSSNHHHRHFYFRYVFYKTQSELISLYKFVNLCYFTSLPSSIKWWVIHNLIYVCEIERTIIFYSTYSFEITFLWKLSSIFVLYCV